MDKSQLLHRILSELSGLHEHTIAAARQAHDTATHEENVAENKYDTLGLEAAYLAHGQSQRVAQCASDLQAFRAMKCLSGKEAVPIRVSSLVTLSDEFGAEITVFLGPAAGGVKVSMDDRDVVIVTPASPLGQALLGKDLDDECKVKIGDQSKQYFVESIE